MQPDNTPSRLSQMSTAWTLLFQARAGNEEELREARRQLIQQYSRPIYRYLLAAVRDEHVTDELYQEFALRLVRGDFQRVHPDRGRFRDFLKTTLYHLIIDHHRDRRRRPESLDEVASALVEQPPDAVNLDAQFIAGWREDLLARAWNHLASEQRRSGQPYHLLLQLRTSHPDWNSGQLAQELSKQLNRTVTPTSVRKTLQRARAKFSNHLIGDVARGVDTSDPDEIRNELDELGLLDYCRDALERFASSRRQFPLG